ncbi:MAG: hypothetical protein ACR2F2_10425 [Pyrinomonadaceae bacterium]
MKAILISSFCLFFSLTIFAQPPVIKEKSVVGIESIVLMRDDGDGNADDEVAIFNQTDIPIHCQIQLDSFIPAIVKMNLIATDVKGLKAESKIITVSYKTNGEQNIVNFKGAPDNVWLAGKYRIDIFINEKLAGNKEFEIQLNKNSTNAQTNFVQPNPKPKTAVRRPRKN